MSPTKKLGIALVVTGLALVRIGQRIVNK